MPDRRPEKCTCNPDTWPQRDPIPGVCATYVQPPKNGRVHCDTCGHDPQCHDPRFVVRRSPRRTRVELVS